MARRRKARVERTVRVPVRGHVRKIGITKGYYRERQFPPGGCQPKTLRTKSTGKDHKLVVCRPKGKKTTAVQSILHPRNEREAEKLGIPKNLRRREPDDGHEHVWVVERDHPVCELCGTTEVMI